MIRPCRPHDDSSESVVYEIGSAVDAWRNDGWWEGLVIGVNGFSNVIKVYFPGTYFLVTLLFIFRMNDSYKVGNKFL